MNPTDFLVEATSLTAGYGRDIIWQSASFNIKAGEFVVLLGPNGAGKTTLFKLILGLKQPIGGQITVFGHVPEKGNSDISYMPQKRLIDSESRLNTIEYVKLGISGHKLGFSIGLRAKAERDKALRALELVDASKFADVSINKLSGGELQRIFLAQALVEEPKLLLLDEPLANLDIKREVELVDLIKNIIKQNNIAVVLIAHDINPLLSAIDRIIYIANKKVASGSPDEIVTSDNLSKLYGFNIEVLRSPSGQIAVLGTEGAIHAH